MFIVYLIERGYLTILLPAVYAYVLLTVINGVWMEEKLTLLLELLASMAKNKALISPVCAWNAPVIPPVSSFTAVRIAGQVEMLGKLYILLTGMPVLLALLESIRSIAG